MAFLLPNLNLSSPTPLLNSKDIKPPIILHHHHHHPLCPPPPSTPRASAAPLSAAPPPPSLHDSPSTTNQQDSQRNDFYVNLGLAVRTLREDLPLLFTKDLNYHIYRDDVTFSDPLNTFAGIENYKLIFGALRFHGRILFREIGLEVLRIWQPSENVILIRWNLRGIPRVPWEAKGQFQGTSRYKLDRHGKIYEHKVDNLAFNFPQPLKPAASVLDLVAACPASPNPTFLLGPVDDLYSSYATSWVKFYRAVRETLDQDHHLTTLRQSLVTCS